MTPEAEAAHREPANDVRRTTEAMAALTARYLAGDSDVQPEDVRAAIDDYRLAAPSAPPEECGVEVNLTEVAYGNLYDPCRKPKGHTGPHDPSAQPTSAAAPSAPSSGDPLDEETLADILAGHRDANGHILPPLIGIPSRFMDPHEFARDILRAARLASQREPDRP